MRHFKRRGFTLVELLVVIGMIVLLATILLPMVNHAYAVAKRAAMAADLLAISEALEAYKGDFGDYPRLDHNTLANPNTNLPTVIGAPLLCWALVAPGAANSTMMTVEDGSRPNSPGFTVINPGDGADGPGFRIRGTTGPVKGPYLPPERFLIGTMIGGVVYPPGANPVYQGPATFDNAEDVLADRNYSPILYYPATRNVSASSAPNGFVSPKYNATTAAQHPSVFYYDDNQLYLDLAGPSGAGLYAPIHPGGNPANLTVGANGWKVMSYRLGNTSFNGVIGNNEVPVTTGPYLLWSPGPDTIFGNDDDVMCDGTQLQQVRGPLPFYIMPRN